MKLKLNQKYFLYPILIILSFIFAYYVFLAGSRVPIMDFWEWISDYGPKFADHSISFMDFIVNPDKSTLSAQHISPLTMALQFGILYLCKFDVRVLVIIGSVLKLLTAWILVFFFIRKFKNQSINQSASFSILLFAVLLFAAYLNLNQWEILSQPFAFTFSIRLGLFFLTFAWAQHYFNQIPNRSMKKNILHTILLGGFCLFLTLMVCSAYFVGFLFAILFTNLIKLIVYRDFRKKGLIPFILLSLIMAIGIFGYLFMISLSSGASASLTGSLHFDLLAIIQGILVYLGALFIPQSYIDTLGYRPFMIAGIVLLIVVAVLFILYFALHLDKQDTFSFMCIIYAGTTSATITVARIGTFGVATMASSRYIVESTVGLVGLIWLAFEVFQELSQKQKFRIIAPIFACILLVSIFANMRTEMKIAPYRGLYNQQLYENMLNIDDLEDDEITTFQAKAPTVRRVIQFFKDNEYSIFAPGFKYR